MDGKIEALLLVSEDLSACQIDRDGWRQKAEAFTQQIQQLEIALRSCKEERLKLEQSSGQEREHLLGLLNGLRKETRMLQEDDNNLRQQLKEAKGDIKLLRQQLTKVQLGPALEQLKKPAKVTRSERSSTGTEGGEASADPILDSVFVSEEPVAAIAGVGAIGSLEELEKLREQVHLLFFVVYCIVYCVCLL